MLFSLHLRIVDGFCILCNSQTQVNSSCLCQCTLCNNSPSQLVYDSTFSPVFECMLLPRGHNSLCLLFLVFLHFKLLLSNQSRTHFINYVSNHRRES